MSAAAEVAAAEAAATKAAARVAAARARVAAARARVAAEELAELKRVGPGAAQAAAAVASFEQKWGEESSDAGTWMFCACMYAQCQGCDENKKRDADWHANKWAFEWVDAEEFAAQAREEAEEAERKAAEEAERVGAKAARGAAAVASFKQKWGDPAEWQFCACMYAQCQGDCDQGKEREADWDANKWAFELVAAVDREVAADDEVATPRQTLRAENAQLRAENARLRADLEAYAVDVVDLSVDDDVRQLAQPSDTSVAGDDGAAANGAGVKRSLEVAQLHQRLTTVKREKHSAIEEADEHQELAKALALTVDNRQSYEDELQKQLRQAGLQPISWQEFRDGARA